MNDTEAPDAQKHRKGIARIAHATRYSLAGLRAALHESAFRLELLLAIALLPMAFWVGRSALERALLIATLFIVLITELLNTAIEKVVDLASPEWHALAKLAKDFGSAAVFLALALVVVVWSLIGYQTFR